MNSACPDEIRDEAHLDEVLSEPPPYVVDSLARLDGDLLILGVSGKMGPTLARMAVRAFQLAGVRRQVLGVARFTDPTAAEMLRSHGVTPITCDLLDPSQLDRLPDVPNVIAMTAMKFGSHGQEARTWAVNTFLSGLGALRFQRSRIVAFSTGNVYALSLVQRGGSLETDTLGPIGEYAMSCMGRERLYTHFSQTLGTRVAIARLNYACELRYGVLVDIARKVWTGEAIDVTMGSVNVIWQADANAAALAMLEHTASPPLVLNVAGPETLAVRQAALEFGQLLERTPNIVGSESPEALISNAGRCHRLFGYPRVSVGRLMRWIAAWVRNGGTLWNKPTKFQVRDGRF